LTPGPGVAYLGEPHGPQAPEAASSGQELTDWLRGAIEYLEAAARVTDDDLRRRFERNRR
jgi:hypothetical protein